MLTENVIEMTTCDDIIKTFPIMKQLRTHLDRDTYVALVEEAMADDQYRLVALFDNDKMVAVVGFKPMITLYYGRFVWVCDLVTDNASRSNGYGEKLLTYVEEWARAHSYEKVALSSGLQRTEAHRFYEKKMGYDKASYVFKKELK
ncbi:GNAT family N-acetyltransferase [Salipaludibacillus agaradhaerens]|jgi:GNAT superfamily N-acetyltransferase|uniref:GNAT family N-acetyltransferase n=1 Tax=Salipaludibacillus agaradhaerens TaxID=76935 RepID=A0A9Q4G026_SALAG|nr:GNAT family N-acetyltransferase [Salipaludibacillus agaradhaerens]MCR6098041.1 GNAT family N-acetyltransferase [Salipaludibacillus agaradhaerens]MCR6116330.1 GNAT family N-acetyltransferase [Salipaludibacillus agaradhaerens]